MNHDIATEADSFRIFQINDSYWLVARSLEEAKEHYLAQIDQQQENVRTARELQDYELDNFLYLSAKKITIRTFRKELAQRCAAGLKAPEVFANNENLIDERERSNESK